LPDENNESLLKSTSKIELKNIRQEGEEEDFISQEEAKLNVPKNFNTPSPTFVKQTKINFPRIGSADKIIKDCKTKFNFIY
jgi:hypothetical protein